MIIKLRWKQKSGEDGGWISEYLNIAILKDKLGRRNELETYSFIDLFSIAIRRCIKDEHGFKLVTLFELAELLTKENIAEPMRDIRRALLEADVSGGFVLFHLGSCEECDMKVIYSLCGFVNRWVSQLLEGLFNLLVTKPLEWVSFAESNQISNWSR